VKDKEERTIFNKTTMEAIVDFGSVQIPLKAICKPT